MAVGPKCFKCFQKKTNKQKTKQHMHKKGSVLQKGCKTWHLTSQSDKNLTHLQEVHETNTQITPQQLELVLPWLKKNSIQNQIHFLYLRNKDKCLYKIMCIYKMGHQVFHMQEARKFKQRLKKKSSFQMSSMNLNHCSVAAKSQPTDTA